MSLRHLAKQIKERQKEKVKIDSWAVDKLVEIKELLSELRVESTLETPSVLKAPGFEAKAEANVLKIVAHGKPYTIDNDDDLEILLIKVLA